MKFTILFIAMSLALVAFSANSASIGQTEDASVTQLFEMHSFTLENIDAGAKLSGSDVLPCRSGEGLENYIRDFQACDSGGICVSICGSSREVYTKGSCFPRPPYGYIVKCLCVR